MLVEEGAERGERGGELGEGVGMEMAGKEGAIGEREVGEKAAGG